MNFRTEKESGIENGIGIEKSNEKSFASTPDEKCCVFEPPARKSNILRPELLRRLFVAIFDPNFFFLPEMLFPYGVSFFGRKFYLQSILALSIRIRFRLNVG
jgi:hypothetical protein